MRPRIAAGIVAVVLAAGAWWLPELRRALIFDVTWWDARPTDTAPLPAGTGSGFQPAPHTRVVLIDGLDATIAAYLPQWSAVCKRGITLTVDVGFPTISLPVEAALWTGLTQQQTGIVSRNGGHHGSYGRPLEPPLANGIPARVAGSIAIAEDHGWIVRSLGFARVEPPADPADSTKDANPTEWRSRWQAAAAEAVGSAAPLVFVHILRVDTAGHANGIGEMYVKAAAEADAILGRLVDADRGARWFVLSDHGHAVGGGHGGSERDVRQVQGCIAGPGVVAGRGELVHVVDVARALADSTGAALDPGARGRPITAALATPLTPDQAVPPIELSRGAVAIFLLVLGIALSAWSIRRWWLTPWWFVIACTSLYLVHGLPTLSSGATYRPEGRDLYLTWLPALGLAATSAWLGLARTTLARVVIAQLAVPVFTTAAALAACGAWPAVFGAEVAPVAPRYTAWALVLLLMVAHGAGAVALAVLARLVRPASGRPGPAAPPRTEPAGGA